MEDKIETSDNWLSDVSHIEGPGGMATLHFINATAMSIQKRGSSRQTEEARHIRAHVMKDYLHNKRGVSEVQKAQAPGFTLSKQQGRFRLLAKGKEERRKRRKKYTSAKPLAEDSTSRPRSLMPKGTSGLENAVTAMLRINAPPTGLGLSLPIESSNPGTMTLLEYYNVSFWANSLAVNPEGAWLSVALSDPALLHATLCLVALHRYRANGAIIEDPYFWHRGKAMQIISERLLDPKDAVSDTTIGAIAILSTSDNAMAWSSDIQTSHIKGLLTLVELRGGIDGMSTNKHIKRVVAWADNLHATAHNTLPQLDIAKCTSNCDTKPLLDLIKRHSFSKVNSTKSSDIEPAALNDVFHNLRVLAKSRSMLLHSDSRELRPIYSSILFRTERRILELGHGPSESEVWEDALDPVGLEATIAFAEAIKAATLIFTFHCLRDLNISAKFFERLVQRLRDNLDHVLDQVLLDETAASEAWSTSSTGPQQQHLSFLLWLCLNGWSASSLEERKEHQTWFVEQAARICEFAEIGSAGELGGHLRRIVFVREYCLPSTRGLWDDISGWRVSHSKF